MKKETLLLVLLAASVSGARGVSGPGYTITDLGALYPESINSAARISGYIESGGYDCPAAWVNGAISPLQPENTGGFANAINNHGLVVGWNNSYGAITWDSAGQISVLAVASGAYSAKADAVNDQGVIAGSCQRQPSGLMHACAWNNGVFTDLGVPYGLQSTARSINNLGAIAVDSWLYAGQSHSYLYNNGQFTPLLTDVPSVSYCFSRDINDAGMVVGAATLSNGAQVGYLWQNGVTTLLPTPPGKDRPVPLSVNSSGVIAGSAWDTVHYPGSRACVWNEGQVTFLDDLLAPDSGWALVDATDINEVGQIVGNGQLNGVAHGFLLTPIPEPSSLAVLSLGAACGWKLSGRRRRAQGRSGRRCTRALCRGAAPNL